jgi:hypothetical protein
MLLLWAARRDLYVQYRLHLLLGARLASIVLQLVSPPLALAPLVGSSVGSSTAGRSAAVLQFAGPTASLVFQLLSLSSQVCEAALHEVPVMAVLCVPLLCLKCESLRRQLLLA